MKIFIHTGLKTSSCADFIFVNLDGELLITKYNIFS